MKQVKTYHFKDGEAITLENGLILVPQTRLSQILVIGNSVNLTEKPKPQPKSQKKPRKSKRSFQHIDEKILAALSKLGPEESATTGQVNGLVGTGVQKKDIRNRLSHLTAHGLVACKKVPNTRGNRIGKMCLWSKKQA